MHPFLTQLFQNLESAGLSLTGLLIDHIAYRAATIEEGDTLKWEWSSQSTRVDSAQVNGREVCIFALKEPILFGEFQIPSSELMYPKPSKPYGGWDHIEVVLWPYSSSIDDVRARFQERFPDFELSATEQYSYEEDGLHMVDGQVANPCITIRFTDKTAIRFHTADIWDIIGMIA